MLCSETLLKNILDSLPSLSSISVQSVEIRASSHWQFANLLPLRSLSSLTFVDFWSPAQIMFFGRINDIQTFTLIDVNVTQRPTLDTLVHSNIRVCNLIIKETETLYSLHECLEFNLDLGALQNYFITFSDPWDTVHIATFFENSDFSGLTSVHLDLLPGNMYHGDFVDWGGFPSAKLLRTLRTVHFTLHFDYHDHISWKEPSVIVSSLPSKAVTDLSIVVGGAWQVMEMDLESLDYELENFSALRRVDILTRALGESFQKVVDHVKGSMGRLQSKGLLSVQRFEDDPYASHA
ncbi:unnamed protein product [Somion occarium]|uniref:Uncharacterized protein n=1 Tax=Somion occarium TaxID=3059160 RepID=A0ABP1DZZ1_9APHY